MGNGRLRANATPTHRGDRRTGGSRQKHGGAAARGQARIHAGRHGRAVPRRGARRAALLDLQRQAGERGGVVLEGRDIGTVVFPDAEVKFFLTASPEVRAKRRYEELVVRGQNVDYAATLAEVKARDENDMNRPIAPLRRADDALLVDSSDRAVEDIVEEMARRVPMAARA